VFPQLNLKQFKIKSLTAETLPKEIKHMDQSEAPFKTILLQELHQVLIAEMILREPIKPFNH
jgi:hypothetical protein